MKTPRVALFALVALCLAPSALAVAADAVPYAQQQGDARLRVEGGEIRDGAVVVPLSGVLQVTVSVSGPPTLEVEPIKALTPADAWGVRTPVAPAERVPAKDARVQWQQTFLLEPLKPGEVPLPLVPLRYRVQPGEEWRTAHWEAVPVQVTTEVGKPDLKELRDNPPPLRLPEPPPAPWWLLWLGAALVLVLFVLGLTGWGLRRLRRTQPAPPAPGAWALGELDRIEALGLPALGETNRYHTLLSDVVRHYLERRFSLRAPRQTTTEFLQALAQGQQLTPAQQELLRAFLERCDLAKFARVALSPEECQATAVLARSLVEQTAPPAAPPARTA